MNNPFIPAAVFDAEIAAPCLLADDTHAPSDYWTPDAVAAAMPPVMRIMALSRTLDGAGPIRNVATLYHDRCTVRVDWITQQVDARLHRHGLVTIRHALTARSANGALRVQRLLPADRPQPAVNLFETVPPGWVKDRELVRRAGQLWDALPRPLAHLVNAVFWDSARFHRFVLGPSSLKDHHNGWNGNFRHSVEVAEHARQLGARMPLADVPLLIAAGLLHDAGKAAEYRLDRASEAFRLTDRGELVGHRDTLIEWLAVARATGGVVMADETYLALLHVINAVRAPDWMGLRSPRCLEAEILSMADRLSGHEDIHARCAPGDGHGGFGDFHRRLGRRSYVTPRTPGN